jgi:hypothetical protein
MVAELKKRRKRVWNEEYYRRLAMTRRDYRKYKPEPKDQKKLVDYGSGR